MKTKEPLYFSLSDLRKEFDVTPRALRFYETRGLLNPSRIGTTRNYDRRDRARLQLILQGKRFGFTLTEIKELLDLYSADENGAEQRRVVYDKYRHQAEYLRKQISDMTAALDELEACSAEIERTRVENGEIQRP